MSVVRIEALRALAGVIEAAVPELAGKVNTGQQPSSTVQTYPTLTIIPGPLKYDPAQAIESATIGDPAAGVVVFNVGAHYGPIQLRLVTTTIGERWTLEQKIEDLFLGGPMRPGVVVVPVTTCADLGNWIAAFELDGDQWVDMGAFDRKLESLITVNGVIPALVTRTDAYPINTLVLGVIAGIAPDFNTTITPDTMVPPGVEVVQIHDDGTMTTYP